MSKAAMNTLLGMGTVFLVLIFLSLLISGFKFINIAEQKFKAKNAPAPAAAAAAPAVTAAAPVEEEEELVDDLELVAVITAAIAAATNSSTDGLVVRSIKRAPAAKWKRA
jgi:sodium pump decarboxylase gamma subunit